MKVLLDIKDNKVDFIMELLKNFKFVKAKKLKEYPPYKEEVLNNVREAVEEMKLIKAGKLKGIPAKDLLNEL
ncbi:MAG TPA: hypothetical protein VNZ49_17505 [Bacteroidia bacterium]|jgi:hypothetical protein|nr:hypothetical protein [Bacteroidia bacterium]